MRKRPQPAPILGYGLIKASKFGLEAHGVYLTSANSVVRERIRRCTTGRSNSRSNLSDRTRRPLALTRQSAHLSIEPQATRQIKGLAQAELTPFLLGVASTYPVGVSSRLEAPCKASGATYVDQLRLDGDAVPVRSSAPLVSPARALGTQPVPAPPLPAPPPPAPPTPAPAPAESSVLALSRPLPVAKQELSTIEAAKFLNASHLFIAQEIDAGRLKCRQVGVDLRITMSDLVDYAVQTRPGG